MANITDEIGTLMNATYGSEVRDAIRDALLKIDNELSGVTASVIPDIVSRLEALENPTPTEGGGTNG